VESIIDKAITVGVAIGQQPLKRSSYMLNMRFNKRRVASKLSILVHEHEIQRRGVNRVIIAHHFIGVEIPRGAFNCPGSGGAREVLMPLWAKLVNNLAWLFATFNHQLFALQSAEAI
jgi:hypothetical protein